MSPPNVEPHVSTSISAWDSAPDDPAPCKRCGARVAVWKHLGGPMEHAVVEKRCRRCRNDQKE
jgi:hypothetical protein